MEFKPMTDEEIEMENVIKAGTTVPVDVRKAADYVGKTSGKTSIKLDLTAYHEGREYFLSVYLTPAFPKLWKRACTAMISQMQYETGKIDAVDFEGKHCSVTVDVEEFNNKKQNKVIDFIRSQKAEADNLQLPF